MVLGLHLDAMAARLLLSIVRKLLGNDPVGIFSATAAIYRRRVLPIKDSDLQSALRLGLPGSIRPPDRSRLGAPAAF